MLCVEVKDVRSRRYWPCCGRGRVDGLLASHTGRRGIVVEGRSEKESDSEACYMRESGVSFLFEN